VRVLHRLRNTLAWDLELLLGADDDGAEWPWDHRFPPRGTHPEMLEPTNPLIMWAFTDLRDERYTFLEKYFVLKQYPDNSSLRSVGHFNEKTWGAYLLGSDLFIKKVNGVAGKAYPDMGCSYETFTRHDMLEIETLGPLTKVAPGAVLEHVELGHFIRMCRFRSGRMPHWMKCSLP
jgi:hypothetical protein